ncbi:uncharacterized protein LTR77_006658 [Saxophila tyrrhenica]|uniref:Uncharacterized protein n=1 Tax=Saxophila tyrrhenica TaxID=1690608 RepID=A0AAV9P8V6_9PEZI|nr:hypothetical protein LTR77_006658 [Saxophila tyrrhenica]
MSGSGTRTFSNGDPAERSFARPPGTPAGVVRVSRRRAENTSSESSNSADTLSAGVLSPTSTMYSSPGSASTAGTDPDTIDIPTAIPSIHTLCYFGLAAFRAEQIMKRWEELRSQGNEPQNFGRFAGEYLHNLVKYEGCDTSSYDADWRANLEKIGADEQLTGAIGNRGHGFDDIRSLRSAAEWVEQAIEWRWEYLLGLKSASATRKDGGITLPTSSPIQVRSLTSVTTASDDASAFRFDRQTGKTFCKGEPTEFLPFWKGITRVRAEDMWSNSGRRTGTFDIKGLISRPPGDFSGKRAVYYFTPDLEGAQEYADFAKQIASPAGVCLVRIDVPIAMSDP